MSYRKRRPTQISLSALVFWLFAEALFNKLDQILQGQRIIVENQRTLYQGEGIIMAAVQVEQDDLDAVGASLEALVDVVRQIDTSKLPAADQSKLLAGLQDVTAAVNDKLSPATPVTPPTDADVSGDGSGDGTGE